MEKKVIENINIEKNKELFEYEMTEVILKLKGEFATFSGKGTKYEANKVAEDNLKMELYPLENVSLETYKGKVPDIKEISLFLLDDVKVELEKIDGLTPRELSLGEIRFSPLLEKEIMRIDMPRLSFSCNPFMIEEKKKICINVPQINCHVGEKKFKTEINNKTKKVVIKSVPKFSFTCSSFWDNVETQYIKVALPSTTLKVPESGSINFERIEVKMPMMDINCSYTGREIKTEKKFLKLDVPSVKVKKIKSVYNIPRTSVKRVSVPALKHVQINPVDTKNIRIIISNTDIEQYKGRKFEIEEKNAISEVPNVPVVNKFVINDCEITQKKIESIMIPHLGNKDFKVNKVEMNLLQRVEIPSKLDVKDDIDTIVSLAIR